MISRRNIRVKVMQTLYALITMETANGSAEPERVLQKHFDQTRSLLVYLTWFLAQVARYAETDAHHRAAKHLPKYEDLHVNTKIAGNEVLWKMLEDPALKSEFKSLRPELIFQRTSEDPQELVRRIYQQLSET